MTTKTRHLLKQMMLGGVMLLFTISCRSSSKISAVTFADLCLLDQESFMYMSNDEVVQWIENEFGRPPIISIEGAGSSIYAFNGISDRLGKFVGNVRVYEGRIIEISLHEIQNGPRFDEVVMGLGDPSTTNHYYGMPYDPLLYTIGLDYPTIGISVFASESESHNKLLVNGEFRVVLRENMQVTLTQCYQPASSIEEIINRDLNLTPASREAQLQSRAPWLGFGSIIRLIEP